jgi:hypothetical protein
VAGHYETDSSATKQAEQPCNPPQLVLNQLSVWVSAVIFKQKDAEDVAYAFFYHSYGGDRIHCCGHDASAKAHSRRWSIE